MPDPIGPLNFNPIVRPHGPGQPDPAERMGTAAGRDFKSTLLDSLEEVNRLQQEATAGVQKLATGDADNVAEVLSAVRKADIAFSMMMEMRNKLVDAYRELQQMRV